MMDTKRQQNEEKLYQFILDLDDVVFNTLTSQILNMNLFPVVSNAYAMIIKEERYHIMARNKEICAEAVAFVARATDKISLFVRFAPMSEILQWVVIK